jgi:hypothetical protein
VRGGCYPNPETPGSPLAGRAAGCDRLGMDPMVYMVALLGALGICGIATQVAPSQKRACPQCSVRIAITARRCRFCGYQLT